jgi:hypothetical protein
MKMIELTGIDYVILILYFAVVLGIGWLLKRHMSSSDDFLMSGRSMPAWVSGLAFLSANLGAQEALGMAASGAKYGIATSHFYWIGALPAMVFVGLFMMPFYYGSRARSVPEYLKLRFDEKTRGFNAITFAVMTIFSSGISMYAMGLLLGVLLGWDFNFSIGVSAVIVLAYTFLGGLTSAIYNEVIQFFLIVAAGVVGLARRGRVGRSDAAPQCRRAEERFRAGHLDVIVGAFGLSRRQPAGHRMDRHADGSGVRAVFRILVYELSGGPTGDGGRLDGGRSKDAADRRGAQDVLPVHHHRSGHDCDGPDVYGRLAAVTRQAGRHAELRPGDSAHA